MNLLKTTLMASVALGVITLTSGTIQAEEGFLGGEFSANVSLFSEYRFRGVSLTDKDFALQGGFDYAHDSGFYVGTWASTISASDAYGEIELDVYGGYAGEIQGISYNIGTLLYSYPTGDHSGKTDFLELYGSTGVDLGFLSGTVGAAYIFSNEATGHEDNIYIYTNVDSAIPDTPLTIKAHLGYEDGAFADKKLDWLLGVSVNYSGLDFGVSYVDTDKPGRNYSAAVVFSVGSAF
ncbi:MAG: TorF family putative porin [Emcibacter sp.]|nr:TorF family putative porin [Emcibacter sp.]